VRYAAVNTPIAAPRRASWSGSPRTAAVRRRIKPAAVYSESELHQTVAEFLDLALLPPAIYSTFPAGWGKLSWKAASHLKKCGMKPGMPDIFVFDRVGPVQATKVIGLELKKPGEKASAAQQLMFPRLREVGIAIYVCESLDDVVRALTREKIGLRILKWQDERRERKRKPHEGISAKPAVQDAGDADGLHDGDSGRHAV
jgi:hypothetical protein